jgi:hypothetical protein
MSSSSSTGAAEAAERAALEAKISQVWAGGAWEHGIIVFLGTLRQ